MSSDIKRSKTPTRRAFLGWWVGALLTATVAAVVAPLGVYIFPPRTANSKQKIRVSLAAPVATLPEGGASRFDAPAGMAFVMADGGEQNAAGNPTFGGFLTRDHGTLRAFAITCPHLGCSYAFDQGKKHFVCPCHGSEFALDGAVIHGPATSPLSHLTWEAGPGPNDIYVEGLSIGS